MNNSNILSIHSMLPTMTETHLAKGRTYVDIDFGTSTTVVSIPTKEDKKNTIKTLPGFVGVSCGNPSIFLKGLLADLNVLYLITHLN